MESIEIVKFFLLFAVRGGNEDGKIYKEEEE